MSTINSRDVILKSLGHLEAANDLLKNTPETFKRADALQIIERAHQAIALLLLV